MRELRLVGPGEDGDSVIVELSTGSEQFSLPVDERLRAASRSDRAHLGRLEVAGALRPRDIQVRVRAGEDPQHLAEHAGVDLDRVMRFAYPVLAERGRVADEARRARARQGDGQLVDFGELLDSRLAGHGIDPESITWDAYRRPDGGWTVTARFLTADGRTVLCKFSFVLANRTVSALDDLAADLLADRPSALLQAPEPASDTAPDITALDHTAPDHTAPDEAGQAEVAAQLVPGTATALPRLAAVPDAEHATIEIPIISGTEEPGAADPQGHARVSDHARVPEHAGVPGHARASGRQRARTHPLPVAVDDDLFDQDALLGAPGDRPDITAADDRSADQLLQVPDAGGRRTAKHGDKPRMPSWDDILLGVRRKSD